MEQWPTQVTCNQPGGTSILPCKAMAHSHKSAIMENLNGLPVDKSICSVVDFEWSVVYILPLESMDGWL